MTAPGAERPLILLAAGAPDISALAHGELDSLGVRLLVVTDAEVVVEAAVTQPPVLCIVDAELPGARRVTVAADQPGLEVCRRLKRDPRSARIPILVLAGSADRANHARAIDAGADDVVSLPDAKALLGLRVRALLRLKAATDALDESGRRLRELEKVRDDLMKMIVHDLKTPLTSVLATLEILGDGDLGDLTAEQHDAVDDMRERGNELLTLIDDLLQVWRIEATTLPLSLEDITPAHFLDELMREWEYRFRHERAQVHVEAPPDAPPFRGDRAVLRRVLGNLFQNALTHSPGPVALRVSARGDRRGVLFTVADSGTGIPPEYHEVIFRKFHRLPGPNDARARGSGLGLAFCRLAVEAHGGRIWVQSEEGRGSAFHVLMPLDPGQAPVRTERK